MNRAVRLGPLLLVLVASLTSQAQFVKLEGRKFMLNGQEFYPVGVNFSVELASDLLNDPAGIYPVPNGAYGPSIGKDIECGSLEACHESLRSHLQKVREMGLNSIRLLTGITMGVGSDGWYFAVKQNLQAGEEPMYKARVTEPDFQDAASQAYFNAIRVVLDIAEELDLKVILLCADNDGANYFPVSSQADVDRYANFLSHLAYELRDEEALLAYDLWNEPNWSSNNGDPNVGFNARKKREVCDITAQWYNAIHDVDPNHHVTLGSSGFDDLYSWDPNAMWLDFVSLHAYPQFSPFESSTDMVNMTERYNNQLYWHAVESPMPYIVGELSFSAEDATDDHFNDPLNHHLDGGDGDMTHHRMPWMHGSETQQRNFAARTLFSVRSNWGSGYTWWDFQNHRGANLNSAPGSYMGNFFGLLKYGDPNVPDLPWENKLIVSELVNHTTLPFFNDPPEQPQLYKQSHLPAGTPSWKTVQVQNYHSGAPVANVIALIKAHIDHPFSMEGAAYDVSTQIATSGDGQLHLPVIPVPPNHYVTTYEVQILAPGCDPRRYGGNLGFAFPFVPYLDHNIPDAVGVINPRFRYTDQWQNETVSVGEHRDLRAWNDMTVEQTVYQGSITGGAQGLLQAREGIQLLDGFHAQYGSDVHITTGKTFPDCNSLIPFSSQLQPEGEGALPKSRSSATEALDLVFHHTPVDQLLVYPNPTLDHLIIQTTFNAARFQVLDMTGTCILTGSLSAQRTELDVSSLAAGSYALLVDNGNGLLNRRFTKVR